MNCTAVKERMSAYYDAELSSDDRERVAVHLNHCPECSEELARFESLSSMVQRLPLPTPPQLAWQQFQKRLGGESTVEIPGPITRSDPSRLSRVGYYGLRSAIAVAAILLVAVGWLTFDTWFGDGSHNLLAADIRQYVRDFQRDPQAAQQVLLTKYDGETVRLDEAVQRVSYEPAVAAGLPPGYTLNSMYLLKMPCCDCLLTVCQRSDGSKIAIFEYGEEHPASGVNRPGGMAPCLGKDCCLMQIDEQFAINWQKGERHISVVGVRDQAEMDQLAAWLN